MDYKTANAMLTGRNKERKKLANHTYLVRRADGVIAVCLHATDVLRYFPTGAVQYDSGGWRSMTTKDRMNNYGPEGVNVVQANGAWAIRGEGFNIPYHDGLILRNGKPSKLTVKKAESAGKRNARLRERIRKYADAYAEAFLAGDVPAPDGGDCWVCRIVSNGGEGLEDTDHLESHLKERYFVPSMLANALAESGASAFTMNIVYAWWQGQLRNTVDSSWLRRDVRRAIANYLAKRLGVVPFRTSFGRR